MLAGIDPAHQQGPPGLEKCVRAYKRLLATQIEVGTFWELFGLFFFFSFLTIFLSQKTQKHIKVS